MENMYSPADLSAVMNGNGGMNGMWNNPFMYLVWLALFRNGFNGGTDAGVQGAEVQAKLNALSQQISDNQNANSIQSGIANNRETLNSINSGMNCGFDNVNAGISNASMTNLMGQKDLQSAIQSCCCNNQTAILNQTNQLQSAIENSRQATVNGFANLGYIISQQTNELNTNATANTQRILDQMCNNTTQALRDKVAELSQQAQTATILGALPKTECGC